MSQTEHDEVSPLLQGNDDRAGSIDSNTSQHVPEKQETIALRMAAAMYSFVLLGLFNSSIGAVLPLLWRYFDLNDLHVSLVFLTAPIGYIIAAQASHAIHSHFGQRGIAVLAPLLQTAAYGIVSFNKGYGGLLFAFGVQGLGAGLLDGSWCAWTASMERANTMSGLLQGCYSIGGALGPFLVTVITMRWNDWWTWYYFLTAASTLQLFVLAFAFRRESAAVYKQRKQTSSTDDRLDARMMFKYSATWFCAAYFLTYVGNETTISGWVVSFMIRERTREPRIASLSSTGYWIGNVIGRLILGYPTDKLGVRRATGLYIILAILIEFLFAIFSSPAISVVLMTLLGFVMGPLFPSGLVVLTALMPAELHVVAISFVSSIGQIGGALLPFAIGSVIQSLGIGVFRYAILSQTGLALLVWYMFASIRKVVK